MVRQPKSQRWLHSMGNIGGFVGPYLMGWLKKETAGYGAGLTVTSLTLLVGALIAATVKSPATSERVTISSNEAK